MRQAGVIAAGALYGLEHMVDRLAEDHANARRLAEGLAAIPGIAIDPTRVETNILVCSVTAGGRSTMAVIEAFAARGILISEFDRRLIRMVTHYGIEASHIEATLSVARAVLPLGGIIAAWSQPTTECRCLKWCSRFQTAASS